MWVLIFCCKEDDKIIRILQMYSYENSQGLTFRFLGYSVATDMLELQTFRFVRVYSMIPSNFD